MTEEGSGFQDEDTTSHLVITVRLSTNSGVETQHHQPFLRLLETSV